MQLCNGLKLWSISLVGWGCLWDYKWNNGNATLAPCVVLRPVLTPLSSISIDRLFQAAQLVMQLYLKGDWTFVPLLLDNWVIKKFSPPLRRSVVAKDGTFKYFGAACKVCHTLIGKLEPLLLIPNKCRRWNTIKVHSFATLCRCVPKVDVFCPWFRTVILISFLIGYIAADLPTPLIWPGIVCSRPYASDHIPIRWLTMRYE
jgi:hypothetical protein